MCVWESFSLTVYLLLSLLDKEIPAVSFFVSVTCPGLKHPKQPCSTIFSSIPRCQNLPCTANPWVQDSVLQVAAGFHLVNTVQQVIAFLSLLHETIDDSCLACSPSHPYAFPSACFLTSRSLVFMVALELFYPRVGLPICFCWMWWYSSSLWMSL